ncbi:MAG: hypothetical protein WC547_09225 [Candidatus Omnitrophota bacterium]
MLNFDNFVHGCPWRREQEGAPVCIAGVSDIKINEFAGVSDTKIDFALCCEENCAPLYWVNCRR